MGYWGYRKRSWNNNWNRGGGGGGQKKYKEAVPLSKPPSVGVQEKINLIQGNDELQRSQSAPMLSQESTSGGVRDFSKMKVKELKAECEMYGLSKVGLKGVLRRRLEAYEAEQVTGRKRSREVIDLSQHDDENSGDKNDDDVVMIDAPPSSPQKFGARRVAEADLPPEAAGFDGDAEVFLGTFCTDIVGVRYYTGVISNNEACLLQREPNNKYDKNAIRALNVQGSQVGHIKATAALALAPLLDWGRTRFEAYVPRGSKNVYSIPINMNIYCHPLDQEWTTDALNVAYGFQLNPDLLPQTTMSTPPIAASRPIEIEKVPLRSSSLSSLPLPSSSVVPVRQVESLATIESDLERLYQQKDNIPPTEPSEMMNVNLLEYQKKGLAWMIEQERVRTFDEIQGAKWILWEKKTVHNIAGYWNAAANTFTVNAPPVHRGGILADDMGLGKTIQSVALIVTNTPRPRDFGCTLVVCPVSVMQNWEQQLEQHVKEEAGLKVLCWHGSGRCRKKDFIAEHHVVLTTFATLTSELRKCASGKVNQPSFKVNPKRSPLYSITWDRIMLDEGHVIRNRKTLTAHSVFYLNGDRRWVLSGTPIQNKVDDMYSLLHFIGMKPFSDGNGFEWWNRLVSRPLKGRNPSGLARLCEIVAGVTLRRRKNDTVDGKPIVDMVEKVTQKVMVEMNANERKLYDTIEQDGKSIVTAMHNNGELMNNYTVILTMLLRMRQACSHGALVPAEFHQGFQHLVTHSQEDIDNAKVMLEMLEMALKNSSECCICLDEMKDAVITPCRHVFCAECIKPVTERNQPCPLCRSAVSTGDLLTASKVESIVAEENKQPNDDSDMFASSSKLDSLVRELQRIRDLSSDADKSVVFSQWTGFMDLIGERLESEGIQYSRLDGSMDAKKRVQSIKSFNVDPDVKVFLVSLGAGGCGLNLQAANHIFMMDLWWNPGVIDQAIDRVHRLGQTKPVSVNYVVAKDSIDERVLDMVNKKREMQQEVLGNRSKADVRKERLNDILQLFS